eukprot:gene10485-8450_t
MASNDPLVSGRCIRGFSCSKSTIVSVSLGSSCKPIIPTELSLLSFQLKLGIESPDIVPDETGFVKSDEECRTYTLCPVAEYTVPLNCSESIRVPTTCYFKEKSMIEAQKLFQRNRIHYIIKAEKEASSCN